MRIRHFLFAMAFLSACSVFAQGTHAIAFNTEDSVILRWAPVSVEVWERMNQYGWRVERMDVLADDKRVDRLSPDTLRPLTLEALKARFGAGHPHAPIVAQSLYGAEMAPNSDDLRAQLDAAQQARLRWSLCALYADIDPAIGTALGYRWTDRTARKDGFYLYRVISNDPQRPDTAEVGVDRRRGADKVPEGPRTTAQEGEGSITLLWDRALWKGTYTAYWIDRQQGTSGPWYRMNHTPFIPMDREGEDALLYQYTDTNVTDYTPYRYRLVGITPFGMTSLSAPTVTAMGRDRSAPPSPEMKNVENERGHLVVRWSQEAVPDLKGFRVEKAPNALGPWYALHTGLLPRDARRFTDTSNVNHGENHYRVWALDTASNEAVSLQGYGSLPDSVPPAAPMRVHGNIDTTGVVTLHWPWGKERDLLGYRVFFANAADHEYINLTPSPMLDSVWRDTLQLRTLTKDIYYRVVAVDRSFNHSGFSATLHLKKPDVVPPVAPVIERYTVSDTAVVLHFVPSGSDDVERHELLRRSGTDATWRPVTAWAVREQPRTWTDRTVKAPEAYTYALQAVDSAGLRSPLSVPLEVRMPARPQRPGVASVRATQLDQVVQVGWTAPSARVKHYVIYRTRDDGKAVALGSAPGDAISFADVKLPGAGSYRYAVKAVYPDGGSSPVMEMAGTLLVQ